MSDAEFYELLFTLMADIDTQFQFWLTMTFALIVTTFFAGERLNTYLRVFLTVLYAAACGLIVMRWNVAMIFVGDIAELAGKQVAELPSRTFTGSLRMGVFLLGSIGAGAFTVYWHRMGVAASPEIGDAPGDEA